MIDPSNKGGTDLSTGQVSVGTTATKICDAAPGARQTITIVNDSTVDVFLGGSGVTTSTGVLLAGTKGQTLTLSFSGALYGIVGTGTETVSYCIVE